jgi:arginyl-tRNA synthetase
LSEEERQTTATQIAVGALRYFMLKFTRNTVIAFDFREALSFEGETGPYVQYAIVRARNILRKAETTAATVLAELSGIDLSCLRDWRERRRDLALWLRASKLQFLVEQCDRHRRAGLSGEARLSTGAGVQQLLPQAPCAA